MKTETMLAKVEAAIDRNQLAMVRAIAGGRDDVADLCADYHFRLRKIEHYLEDRLSR